jgi:hypothetical protein
VEFVMSGSPTTPTWQSQLVARYPDLFNQEIYGRVIAPGYPGVGDGWRDLVETAMGRIAGAVAAAPRGSVKLGQVKEKFATLRIYLDRRRALSDQANAAIDEAIELAEARSACTCETCGAEGRLFKSGGWFMTACDAHGKGKPVPQKTGLMNLHVTRGIVDGKRVIRTQRYVRATDTFEEIDPSTLNLGEEWPMARFRRQASRDDTASDNFDFIARIEPPEGV